MSDRTASPGETTGIDGRRLTPAYRPSQVEKPVIVTAAMTDAPPGSVKRDAGNDDQVDGG